MNSDKTSTIQEWLGSGSINIFGMLLSGKDTQGHLLAEALSGKVISGGEILRNSPIPKSVDQAIKAGDLIDRDEYLKIIAPYLSRSEFDGQPIILSAVGRWEGEEQTIIKALQLSNHPIKAVIYIKTSEQTAFDRLAGASRNRHDDNPEVLKHRIDEFYKKTIPVIRVYRAMNLVIEVDGMQKPDKVHNEIIEALYRQATS